MLARSLARTVRLCPLSSSLRRISILSSHIRRGSPRPLVLLLSPLRRPDSQTGVYRGGRGCLASGRHPRSPQFPTPGRRRGWNGARAISSPHEPSVVPSTLSGFPRFAFSPQYEFLLAPFSESFNLPYPIPLLLLLLPPPRAYDLSRKSRALQRHECLRTISWGASPIFQEREFFNNILALSPRLRIFSWSSVHARDDARVSSELYNKIHVHIYVIIINKIISRAHVLMGYVLKRERILFENI